MKLYSNSKLAIGISVIMQKISQKKYKKFHSIFDLFHNHESSHSYPPTKSPILRLPYNFLQIINNFHSLQKQKDNPPLIAMSNDLLFSELVQPHKNEQQYFCFILVLTPMSVVIACAYFPFIILVTLYGIKNVKRLWNVLKSSFPPLVKAIYITLLGWGIWVMVEIISNLIIYSKAQSRSGSHQDEYLQDMSKFMFPVVFIAVYIIQTSILMTPYHWMKSTIQFCQNQLSHESLLTDGQNIEKWYPLQKYCIKIIQGYMVIRVIVFIGWVVGIVITYSEGRIGLYRILFDATLVYNLVEAGLIEIVLGIGVFALKKNMIFNKYVSEDEVKQFLRKFYWLMGSVFCRILVFLVKKFPLFGLTFQEFPIQPQCKIYKNEHGGAIFGILLFQVVLMDFASYFTMLKIFRIENEDGSNSNSQVMKLSEEIVES